VAKGKKAGAIKTLQTVQAANPDKSSFILGDGGYAVLSQAFSFSVMGKRMLDALLSGCR
jgi:hypothetical protein